MRVNNFKTEADLDTNDMKIRLRLFKKGLKTLKEHNQKLQDSLNKGTI